MEKSLNMAKDGRIFSSSNIPGGRTRKLCWREFLKCHSYCRVLQLKPIKIARVGILNTVFQKFCKLQYFFPLPDIPGRSFYFQIFHNRAYIIYIGALWRNVENFMLFAYEFRKRRFFFTKINPDSHLEAINLQVQRPRTFLFEHRTLLYR